MNAAPRLRLVDVERFERDVAFRIPFRFGVITVTHGTQAVLRVRIELEDGRHAEGVAAECLGAKWFDKNPALSDTQNLDQLRQALQIAIDLYGAAGLRTAFGHFESAYPEQVARGAALALNPLVANYGPALLDRAILDALGRALGRSFQDLVRTNAAGLRVGELTPDLAGFALDGFLAALAPRPTIDVRHTVGLVDSLTDADRPGAPVGDGLPETLEEVVRQYQGRFYKLKVGGRIDADLDRLTRIAAVLDAGPAYKATLDGNEQYDDVEGFLALWERMAATPALARLCASILFVEQPIKRAVALARPVTAMARHRPLIIDESDGELRAFPDSLALGYSGVSSKTCKGLYKSLLNAARVARINAEAGSPRAFMSAEDLTTWAGVSVQQDLALVALIGLGHVERNGHHFIDGMRFAPPAEQRAFAAGHPDLYDIASGTARLRIAPGGRLALGSLGCPGFAVAAAMDFAAMRPMPAAPRETIVPRGAPA
ncbi:MAG: mandelate racemase [Alphaproteobacteria bacterium]|nr:mandelate racemase [Alphaproteobacteria bacterium]